MRSVLVALGILLWTGTAWSQTQFPLQSPITGSELVSLGYAPPPSKLPLYIKFDDLKTWIGTALSLNNPVISGTVTGTYTLGGTPTITGLVTLNGNTITNGTGTLSLGLGTIFIDASSTTGVMRFGSNNGNAGNESLCFGFNSCASHTSGTPTAFGQSVLISTTNASGTGFGNDVFKFYTGNQSVTGVGFGAAKNIVSCGNCVAIGDGAMINWTTNAGTSNSNTVVGGNNTFAGTAGNGQLNGNDVYGANIAVNASVGANKNIFIGANMLNTTFRNGTNNIVICTNASVTCDTAASNTSNTINLDSVLTWTGTGTVATSVPTIHGLPVLPDVTTGTPAASLCLDASNNVIKKTTAGSCV